VILGPKNSVDIISEDTVDGRNPAPLWMVESLFFSWDVYHRFQLVIRISLPHPPYHWENHGLPMVFPDFFSAVEVDQRVQRLDRDRNDDELARLLKKHEEVLAGEMELGKEPDKVFLRDSERFLRDFNGF